MYGWRSRIGLVVPANNGVIEPEFNKLVPEGVSVYASRMQVSGEYTAETLKKMVSRAFEAVEELVTAGVKVIGYACMSTSFTMDDWDDRFIHTVKARYELKGTTAAYSIIRALKALGVNKVGVASPYPVSLHESLLAYIRRHGFQVVSANNVPVEDMQKVGKLGIDFTYKLVFGANSEKAEAICIGATDLSSLETIRFLEDDLSKPVIGVNQALFWDCMKLAGVKGFTTANNIRLFREG